MSNKNKGKFDRKRKFDRSPKMKGKDRDDIKDTVRCSDGHMYPYHPRTEGENDFSWYNRNPSLTVAASSLPFPYRPGMVPMLDVPGTYANNRIPGVATMHWAPFIGVGGASTDPVNVAARDIFNRVRSAFSGSIDADSPDFVVYLLALDSMFSYIASLKRLYRIVATYTPMNYAIPDVVMTGLGFSTTQSQEIRKNRVLLWQYINELVSMTRKFVCPAVFPLFNRHYWMNDNVYADENSANSQLYVFKQESYLQFAIVGTDGAGGLNYVAFTPPATGVVDYLYTFGLNLIQALSNQDDTFIISGYLARAFSGEASFIVDELREDEKFFPLYVPEVLMQIENSYTPFNTYTVNTMNITLQSVEQNPASNTLKTNFVMATSGDFQDGMVNPFLSIRSDAPTVPEIVEASRLQTYVDWSQSSPALTLIAGTEINLGWTVGPVRGTVDLMEGYDQLAYIPSTVTASDLTLYICRQHVMSAFDWCPFAFGKVDTGTDRYITVFGDTHNFTTFTFEQARQINKICLYSEFNAFGIYP